MLKVLQQLFSKKEPPRVFSNRLRGPGEFSMEVVSKPNETRNRELIWQATSNQWEHRESPNGDFWERVTDARLVSDPDRPDDPCAMCVEIAGKKVGALSRTDGMKIYRRFHQLRYDRIDALCRAMTSGRPESWVVRLDINESSIDSSQTADGISD